MRLMKVVSIGLIFACMLAGCGNQQNRETSQDVEKESIKKEQADTKAEEKTIPEEPESEAKIMILYYVEDSTGAIQKKEVEIDRQDPEIVWAELQKSGLFDESCKLLSFDENAEGILLDVSQEFGNRLRASGTAEENEILTCVINTYLDTFGYSRLKLTEEGVVLETGHTLLEGYMEKRETND